MPRIKPVDFLDPSTYAEDSVQKELIGAMNKICNHVRRKLVPGYQISITLRDGEATLELFDKNSEEVLIGDEPGQNISILDEACCNSFHHDRKSAGE